jgi:hypothetical protein
MLAAFEDAGEWGRVHLATRDALVSYARGRCPYYGEAIPSVPRFEDIPLLTKEIVRTRLNDLLAERVPTDRRVEKRTSGSTGEPLFLYRDRSGPV